MTLGGAMTMVITNARIVLEDETILGNMKIVDDTIAQISSKPIENPGTDDILDAKGCFVMPGVVDLHTHGSGGFDFMDGEVADIVGAASSLAAHGTTTCLPTTLTSSDEELFSFIRNYRTLVEGFKDRPSLNMAKMPGLHLEGPYFDMEQKGHNGSGAGQNQALVCSSGAGWCLGDGEKAFKGRGTHIRRTHSGYIR